MILQLQIFVYTWYYFTNFYDIWDLDPLAPSICIMIRLCFFSRAQWEIKMHLLLGECFNSPHWSRSLGQSEIAAHWRSFHFEDLSRHSFVKMAIFWRQIMLSLTLDYAQVDLTQEKSHKNPKFLLIARPLSVYLFCTPGKEYHSQADLTSQSCYSVNAKSLKAP